MEGNVKVTVCYSSEHEVIDDIEIAYQTVWSDLEEMVNTTFSACFAIMVDQLLRCMSFAVFDCFN